MKSKPKKTQKQPKKPASKAEVSENKEVAKKKKNRDFKINIYRAWCKNCGICTAFCPTKAIVSDETGRPEIADASKCIGCFQCFQRCPDFCIAVFEVEDKDKDKEE
ncbi:MAG: 4Fe-4S binding protein [Planctomycetes bacterium]|nr:4Fe-4S binding protein [Planctomycetota bacterium]